MHCVAAVHGPVAPSVHVTALDAAPDGTTWSGAADGSITCWRQQQQQQQAGNAAVQPVAVLQGHSHPVVALLSGLTGTDTSISNGSGSSHLLSLDAEGWIGLWDCSSWVCLDMTRAAPLPPACTPTLLIMPDGDHVCIVIPATPNLQQEQQTLWQHQRQHQQHQQPAHSSTTTSPQQLQQLQHSATGPATAANLSPMMLVLRWRSLALVAAPLVSNLGLVALTSSSITLDQADTVVASAVINTAPALAPSAADTVVLAVMRSGWMWAGSLAGSSLNQAWERPLVAGGSSASLRHSCLWVTSSSSNMYSSSAGGSSSPEPGKRSAGLQLQLLLVQPDGWRLFACSSFSSSDGMPQQWVQLAQQLQGSPSRSRLHVHGAGSCRQHGTAAGTSASAVTAGRVRFEISSSKAGVEGYSGSESSCSSSSSSTGSDSGSENEGVEVEEGEGGAEGEGGVGRMGSRLRQASGPEGRQYRRQQQGLQLLGGTLLQPAHSGAESLQQQGQGHGQAAVAAVVVWSECGEQQLWSVLQEQGSVMLQQQQPVLVQCLQMHPWPAHAAAKVFAAANRSRSSLSLLTQHSLHLRHHHHHHHHHHQDHQHGLQQQQYQDPSSSSSSSNMTWMLSEAPHKWRSDWHLHCTQVAADSPLQLSQQRSGQQEQAADSLTHAQQLPWQLKHCQGALGAAWHRHDLYPGLPSINDSSSSSASHDSSRVAVQHQQGEPDTSSCSGAGIDAMQIDQNDHMISSSSRKRPAAEAPAAESVVEGSAVGQGGCGPAPGRAKQPRVQLPGVGLHSGQQTGAEQAAAAFLDGQHQQVTHMLLLGSDAPGWHQLAVILASGTILFYDLATYCVPGAAWHPDCCVVGSGHVGRVSTTLEVTFRCPPQHLLGCAGATDSTHGGLQRPVNWHFSSTAAGRADSSARSSHDGNWASNADGSGSSRAAQEQCYEALPECPAAAHGWCSRPAQGGVVPLLLTGGKDGSLRAWDLRLPHLGQPWMAVHPHTAPVEAIVLPPVSSRLPWSTCVLSVCASGRVALSCLASGTTTRTFDGWDLGPPAQLAWSTGRGLLAAGGWDAAGVWQVAVWDTYSGAMDRQLQGAAAHMLMASLAQELTSSMRHLSRAQAQQNTAPATAAGSASGAAGQLFGGVAAAAATVMGAASSSYGQYQSSSISGSKRASFEAAHDGSQAASGDGAKVSSSSGASDASGFTPRLQLVTHAGPLRPVPCGMQDVLVVDCDVQQLVQQLELYAKQQKRESSKQRQQHTGSSRRSSMDVDSSTASARASRASSLDLLGLVQGGVVGTDVLGIGASLSAVPPSSSTSPQQQQHMQAGASQYQQQQTPRAPAAAATGQLHVLHTAAAAMSRQGSLASAAGAAVDHASTQGSSAQPAGVQSQQRRVHGRAAVAPAVAAALQGLCLLHKWGLEAKLDKQLLLLLEQLQGFSAAAAGELLTQSSSTSLPLSPTRPSTPPAAVSTAAAPAVDTTLSVDAQQASAAVGQQLQLLSQLQVLLCGPAAGSPVLQSGAPCLTQEVLLSPNRHAAVIALPSAHSNSSSMRSRGNTHRHQQQQVQAGGASADNQQSSIGGADGVAAATKAHAVINKPPCLLLAACPSLLSCRLLTLVAVSKWLMATIPSHTSVNTCSGLVTLYALHSTELITQAAAAADAELCSMSGPIPATTTTSGSGVRTSPIQPHPKQAQQQQQRERQLGYCAGQTPVLPDLLLIASTSLACPGLLAEAAQLLLAALLQPAAPGTYLPPTLSMNHTGPQQLAWAGTQQQQQQGDVAQQVLTSPGAAAAASCWPPAVLQLAVLYAQQHQQQQQRDTSPQGKDPSPTDGSSTATGTALSLHQLPLWLPQLVLAAAAAVAHPTRTPPELLAAVSAGLLDVLVGVAPAQSSCVAASWLCQVLRGGHWAVWRPYLGKPGHLAQRLCHLIDRLQASSTDSRTAASHLVSQSLSTSTGLQHTAAHSTSASGITPVTITSGSNTGLSGDFMLLSQQPYAVADPLLPVGGISRGLSSSNSNTASSSSSGWAKWRPQHVEGGLFLSSALMGSAAATKHGSWTPGGVSRSASPAAGAVAGLLEVSPAGRVGPAGGSGAFGSSGWIGSGTGGADGSQQQAGLLDLHRTSSGVTYSYSGAQHSPGNSGITGGSAASDNSAGVKHSQAGGLSSISEQQQGMGVRVSRGMLVVWLRAALDVLAALTHVDPAAVLMELSHRLAAPGAESSGTSLTLLIAALSRLLKRPSERHALLPHLGFITALAVQALDPGRPLLRHTLMQPVIGVVKDLAGHFPQADCHSSSLQVAVGSTRALAGPYSGAVGAAAGAGAGASLSSCVQAPAVAVFDLNGGAKKKVLLLPVLMDEPDQQQQQGLQHASPAGPTHGHHRPVGPFGSTGSLHSTTSSASTAETAAVPIPQGLQHQTAAAAGGALPGLWSSAEGVPGATADAGAKGSSGWGGVLAGGSSSSLSSSTAFDTPADSRSGSYPRLGELQRGVLASSTMTRAEVAMVEGWFGGSPGSSTDGTAAGAGGPSATLHPAPGHADVSAAAGASWGGMLARPQQPRALQCGVIYPDAASASSPVLCASEVSEGVAAVAFSPGGDAVAAFVLGCHCLVVWRLGASWTQKLAHLGSSRPMSQMPHAYIRLPQAALLVNAVFKDGAAGHKQQQHNHRHHHHGQHESDDGEGGCGEVLQWQLKWQTDSHIDLLYQGCLCGSVEVHL